MHYPYIHHTASNAPGYGTQPLHWHQTQKDSEGEKSTKKDKKNCLNITKNFFRLFDTIRFKKPKTRNKILFDPNYWNLLKFDFKGVYFGRYAVCDAINTCF